MTPEQTSIRNDVVQPRCSDHSDRHSGGVFEADEERRQVCQPPIAALPPQGRLPISLGVVEVKPNAVAAQPRIGKAAEGCHDPRWRRVWSCCVKAIGPFPTIHNVSETGHVLLPPRVGWIEVTSQANLTPCVPRATPTGLTQSRRTQAEGQRTLWRIAAWFPARFTNSGRDAPLSSVFGPTAAFDRRNRRSQNSSLRASHCDRSLPGPAPPLRP